jgi:hypothetical protein
MLLHGHVLSYDAATSQRQLGATAVRNVAGRHLLDIRPGGGGAVRPSPGRDHAR